MGLVSLSFIILEHLTKWGWCLSVLLFRSTLLNGVGVAQFYYSGTSD